MTQAYSAPRREAEPHALPDMEVWESAVYEYDCNRCGVFDLDEDAATADPDGATCPSCERQGPGEGTLVRTGRKAWFYWFCFPGCLPESDPRGPFPSEKEAMEDAREGIYDE